MQQPSWNCSSRIFFKKSALVYSYHCADIKSVLSPNRMMKTHPWCNKEGQVAGTEEPDSVGIRAGDEDRKMKIPVLKARGQTTPCISTLLFDFVL